MGDSHFLQRRVPVLIPKSRTGFGISIQKEALKMLSDFGPTLNHTLARQILCASEEAQTHVNPLPPRNPTWLTNQQSQKGAYWRIGVPIIYSLMD